MKLRTLISLGALIFAAVFLWGLLTPMSGPRLAGKVALCKTEMANLVTAATKYREVYAGYPAGGPVEVLRRLQGGNPDKIEFVNLNTNRYNSSGEYLDPWGIPYEIKFESTNRVTIRSAGKNKIFGDIDDLTTTNPNSHR